MAMDEFETDKTEAQEQESTVKTATSIEDAAHPAGHFIWSSALGALTLWPWGAVLMTLPHRKALAAQKMEWKYCGHMVLITLFTWFGLIGTKHWILSRVYRNHPIGQMTGNYSNLPVDDMVAAALYIVLYYAIIIAIFVIIGRHAAKQLRKAVPNYPKEIYCKKERVGIIVNAAIWILGIFLKVEQGL